VAAPLSSSTAPVATALAIALSNSDVTLGNVRVST